MTETEIKRLWMGIVVVVLAMTYPSWARPGDGRGSSYDAPWIYPGLDPVVQSQLHPVIDTSNKLSFGLADR